MGVINKCCNSCKYDCSFSGKTFPQLVDRTVFFCSYWERIPVNEQISNCGNCGGKKVFIRGRFPKADKREICPTCAYERLEQIHDISSNGYGIPCSSPQVSEMKGVG